MADHDFKGTIDLPGHLPNVDFRGKIDLPEPTVSGTPGVITKIRGAVEFFPAPAGHTLDRDEIAVVTYWWAPQGRTAQTHTVHYGPGDTIRPQLGYDGDPGELQIGRLSGYLIKIQ